MQPFCFKTSLILNRTFLPKACLCHNTLQEFHAPARGATPPYSAL
nr:MAG TPA: hypothetical protein [Caudoviricetes sp.]